jgi:flagellar protein FliL
MSDDKKKGNKLVKILLILLILVVFGTAGFFGYYFFVKSKGTEAAVTHGKNIKVEEKTAAMEDFTLNLADENAKVYLKAKIFIAYPEEKNKEFDEEIEKKMPEMRDLVITTLRKKTSADFNGDGLEKVRQELISKINEKLIHGQLTNIYFNEIITQ